jgi:hypothetical protein
MFDKLRANIEEHSITAAVFYSILAVLLLVVFTVNITGNQSLPLNAFAGFMIAAGGVYLGYLLFN